MVLKPIFMSRKYERRLYLARDFKRGLHITYPHDNAVLWAVDGLFTSNELKKQYTKSVYICFLVYNPVHEELWRKVTDVWTHKRLCEIYEAQEKSESVYMIYIYISMRDSILNPNVPSTLDTVWWVHWSGSHFASPKSDI